MAPWFRAMDDYTLDRIIHSLKIAVWDAHLAGTHSDVLNRLERDLDTSINVRRARDRKQQSIQSAGLIRQQSRVRGGADKQFPPPD